MARAFWSLIFSLVFSVGALAYVVPVEFQIEEWVRANKLLSPLTLKYEGGLMTRSWKSSVNFVQECTIMPDGRSRTQISVPGHVIVQVRNNDRVVVTVDGLLDKDGSSSDSRKFLNLTWPANKDILLRLLRPMEIFSSSEFEFLQTNVENGTSIGMRARVKQTIYGDSSVAWLFPASGGSFLVDKIRLMPAGFLPSDTANPFHSGHFEVHEFRAPTDPLPHPVPQSVTFYTDDLLVHLRLTSAALDKSIKPETIELSQVAAKARARRGAKPAEVENRGLLTDYLLAWF